MCEYQRIEENKPPMCEYTKELCTYCVLGNGKTYNEALKKGVNNGNYKNL